MREHNIYISESEWDELLKHLPLINGNMSEIQPQNAPKKAKVTLYKWGFTSYGNKNCPTCKFWYYRKEDAK